LLGNGVLGDDSASMHGRSTMLAEDTDRYRVANVFSEIKKALESVFNERLSVHRRRGRMIRLLQYHIYLSFLAAAACLGANSGSEALNYIPVVATFLDTNHEGHLDRIDITWTDTASIRQTMPSVSQWVKTLNLTLLDSVTVNQDAVALVPELANKTIHIILNQDVGVYETGWITATFTLADTVMSLSGKPFSVVSIIDGAAPVITGVCFVPMPAADTLRVVFSEPVTAANMPGSPNSYFSIVKNNGAPVTDTAIAVLNHGNRLLYVYRAHVLNDSESVKEGNRPKIPILSCGFGLDLSNTNPDGKCGCGSGTGLALLPPIGFRIASIAKKRRKKKQ
jgi:hypothetical protein